MPSSQISCDSQNDQSNNAKEPSLADTRSISAPANENRKLLRQDIELVQNSIERCLQLYMNRDEVAKTLLNRARIDPAFTALVWRKLEEENAEFFQAYYIRLKLKNQIILFNQLLHQQYHLMKCPPMVPSVNSLPTGYPIIQHPPIPPPPAAAAAAHFYHHPMMISVVNGEPAPNNYHSMQTNPEENMVIDPDVAATVPHSDAYSSSMTDTPISSASMASSGHFPFTSLDTTLMSDAANTNGLQLPLDYCAGNYRDSLRTLAQFPWNFNLLDLTEDLPNLEDTAVLRNYQSSSPFLHSDSDILLDSPAHEDLVEEFFVDSTSGPTDDKEPSPS
ncbi:unnamed protein product [Cuscuta campestris]|uniref:Angiotensin-converting enzyme 2 n=1 Tax=Cuscuta campestris TaxID=132261 RepID=A0A484MTP6_9ASTE|nr:unnamed protein product [Cuscuta campestris]